ncbi:hypothetical protein KSC_050010 [Ktedonobacter sp. SOSP1-52]|nr:hypothetical protein KSC_050010 [Ktedonobacter sp. SOSP1-52]
MCDASLVTFAIPHSQQYAILSANNGYIYFLCAPDAVELCSTATPSQRLIIEQNFAPFAPVEPKRAVTGANL